MAAPSFPVTACRSCGADVVFSLDDKTDRPMPVNAAPDRGHGNISIYQGVDGQVRSVVVPPAKAKAMRAAGQALHLSHFADCPHAGRWRKDRR